MSLLLLALLIINAVAVWSIISSRHNAEAIAAQDFQFRVLGHARSLEAVLANRRGDFLYLSQSPPMADAVATLGSLGPLARRWSRPDIQWSLLLFLAAHPEVERLVIRGEGGEPLLAAGHREGVPVLLPAHDFPDPLPAQEGLLVGMWPLGAASGRRGSLETVLNVARLMQIAVPGVSRQFTLVQAESFDPAAIDQGSMDSLTVTALVRDDQWPVPVRWTLIGQESQSRLMGSVTLLANRYRLTVILNLVVMTLAVVLGAVGVQQLRRRMALEAENRQQARVRDLERRVMHADRLASVGQLAAGMAHEINNPLEGMSNYLSLLEEDLEAQRTDSALDLVGRVREGHDRIAGIIRQVLAFSDTGAVSHTSVDVNEVLDETVRFVRTNPAFRRIEVILRTPDPRLKILGNRVTLGQLFLNLLMNACQVQPDGGQIEVASLRDGDRAVVLVADCGPGIPPEMVTRIFEPFYSTRGSTGLGLSVCHGIVNEHGGEIRADNRAEGGAIFQVSLPLETAGCGVPAPETE